MGCACTMGAGESRGTIRGIAAKSIIGRFIILNRNKNMKKYKVLFFGTGKMGELVRNVLKSLDNVDFHEAVEGGPTKVGGEGYDLIFSASFPARIPAEICKLTALGAVNLHTGLLPEGRGWHPLNWAIIWGKDKTGITIHKIVDGFDAGDVCCQLEVPIFETDNIVRLRERVDSLVPMVIQNFFNRPDLLIRDAWPQNQAHVSYAPKRRPEESELNMHATPQEIYNLFRSCDPTEYPAFIMVNGVKKIVNNYSLDGVITHEL